MPNGYLRLSEPPRWCLSHPTCSACEVDLELDWNWTCPSCGTTWRSDAFDGNEGDLDPSADGPEATMEEAWQVSRLSGEDRARRLAAIREGK